MKFALPFILYFTGTLLGYGLHWSIHQPWMGRFYRAHMNHHLKQYPLGSLLSERYRYPARRDNTSFFFWPPFILISLGLWFVMPGWMWAASLAMIAVFGIAHDYFHTHFHLKDSWLLRFGWFRHLRKIHFIHHRDMGLNFGIYHFFWDRVFGTYRSRQSAAVRGRG